MNLTERIALQIKRYSRARQLGIVFLRIAGFKMPTHLRVKGHAYPVGYPADNLPASLFVFIENMLDDCYHIEELRHPVKTAIDIGGNMGFSALKIKLQFPDATVHCYEPDPENEPYLKAQSEAGGFTYFLEAIGVRDGKVNLSVRVDSMGLASTIEDEQGEFTQVSFKKAVERLNTDSVDFVKMDCEGAEWDILKDVQSWQKVKTLAMEYHLDEKSGRTFDKIKQTVEGLDFKIYQHLPSGEGTGLFLCSR
jgi:FkbM family methyltransferase